MESQALAPKTSRTQPIVRAATTNDIPSIYNIHKHYVLNTLTTFKLNPNPPEILLSNLQKIQDQKLPFLVAISPSTAELLGYIYVSPFRHEGYKHTVELSLFCHPSHLCQGIGTVLLNKLLDVLVDPQSNLDSISGVRDEDERVRTVIACMSLDPGGRDEGLGLKKYYEGFGFEFSGHLKGVGHKFDRWLDSMYLQKTLW